MKSSINLLHISDIHFGYESNIAGDRGDSLRKRKKTILASMEKLISELDPSIAPSILVISGDIAWGGKKTDYAEAEDWLRSLLYEAKLKPHNVIVCPGNHDIDRETAKLTKHAVPDSIEACDELLSVENLDLISEPFAAFSEFCKNMEFPILAIGKRESYLCGSREICDIKFNVFNSAWFCRGNQDRGQLCLGENFVGHMSDDGKLVDVDAYNEDTITISLIHHPPPWFRDDELYGYTNRMAPYLYLSRRTHIILSGHVHGLVAEPNREASHAMLFTGGATYANAKFDNNFSLFQIDPAKMLLTRRYVRYLIHRAGWDNISEPRQFPLTSKDAVQLDSARIIVPSSLQELENSDYMYRFASEEDIEEIARFSWEIFGQHLATSRANIQQRIEKYREWINDVPNCICLISKPASVKVVGYSVMLRWDKTLMESYLDGIVNPWLLPRNSFNKPKKSARSYIYSQTLYCSRTVGRGGRKAALKGFIDQIISFSPLFAVKKPFLFGPRQLRITQQNARDLGFEFRKTSLSGSEIYVCDLESSAFPGRSERESFISLISQRLQELSA